MWEILIDETRHVWGIVQVPTGLTDAEKAAKRARLDFSKQQLRNAGHTPTTLTLSAFPADFAVGRILSSDNMRCDLQTDTHEPTVLRDRRLQVEHWAVRNTGHEYMLRAVTEMYKSRSYSPPADDMTAPAAPPRGEVWLALVLMTLAAAARKEWLKDLNVWPAIEKNMRVTAEGFMSSASPSRWPHSVYRDIESMAAFFTMPASGGGLVTASLGPTRMPSNIVSADRLREGRAYAELVVYGRR